MKDQQFEHEMKQQKRTLHYTNYSEKVINLSCSCGWSDSCKTEGAAKRSIFEHKFDVTASMVGMEFTLTELPPAVEEE